MTAGTSSTHWAESCLEVKINKALERSIHMRASFSIISDLHSTILKRKCLRLSETLSEHGHETRKIITSRAPEKLTASYSLHLFWAAKVIDVFAHFQQRACMIWSFLTLSLFLSTASLHAVILFIFFFFLRVFYHRFARPWMHSVERNCVSFWVPQLPCRPRHSLKIPCTPAIVKRYREECAGKSGLNVYAAQEQLSVHLLPLLADTRAVGPCAQVPAYNKLATADYNKRSQPRQISQLPEKQTYPLICFGFGRVIS